jgi:hypothetical protein
MRTLEQIDITQAIDKEEFYMIFETQLPLNDGEKKKLREEYFPLYAMFITQGGVPPATSFEATKNVFLSQHPEIKERNGHKIF